MVGLYIHVIAEMYKVVLLLPLAITSAFAQSCTVIGNNPGCACKLEDSGKVIDLSSIGSKDGSARFVHVITSD